MALLKTREHGLDLAKIACRTVELVLSDILLVRAYCTSTALTSVQESPETEPNASLETRITLSEKDTGLIRSLEWLTFDESTHEEALRQANALCRYFMGTFPRVQSSAHFGRSRQTARRTRAPPPAPPAAGQQPHRLAGRGRHEHDVRSRPPPGDDRVPRLYRLLRLSRDAHALYRGVEPQT